MEPKYKVGDRLIYNDSSSAYYKDIFEIIEAEYKPCYKDVHYGLKAPLLTHWMTENDVLKYYIFICPKNYIELTKEEIETLQYPVLRHLMKHTDIFYFGNDDDWNTFWSLCNKLKNANRIIIEKDTHE